MGYWHGSVGNMNNHWNVYTIVYAGLVAVVYGTGHVECNSSYTVFVWPEGEF